MKDMEYLLIAIVALSASLITFFSGFGLGTILMPFLAIFLPLPLAIVLTAVVHFLHSSIRTGLLWKSIDWGSFFRFGSVACVFAIPGALLLKHLTNLGTIVQYHFLGIPAEFSILHLLIGVLLIVMAMNEMISQSWKLQNLYVGGAISGLFGGLSGHQGAFRSVFLSHLNLNAKEFVGTTAAISVLVDFTRLIIYSTSFGKLLTETDPILIGSSIGGAVVGLFVGMIFLKKITNKIIRNIIIISLTLLGILMSVGII